MRGLLNRPSNKYVWILVHKCDLPFPTVRSLLIRGWTYQESTVEPPKWVAPKTKEKL